MEVLVMVVHGFLLLFHCRYRLFRFRFLIVDWSCDCLSLPSQIVLRFHEVWCG
ncbi:hypothetical protein Sjap_024019 [Stephania japonica]|uniref:Uncharacterized protein n=1 Tax=Stephania japonica TaxID=461633 RepID=A0AAP0EHF8_9MAGN